MGGFSKLAVCAWRDFPFHSPRQAARVTVDKMSEDRFGMNLRRLLGERLTSDLPKCFVLLLVVVLFFSVTPSVVVEGLLPSLLNIEPISETFGPL